MTRALRASAASTCVALAIGVSQPPTSGAIEGRVIFEGTPPAPTFVIEGGRTQHVLYVDQTGGLQYAVVFLNDVRAGAAPTTPATLNQRDFIFEPQVLAVRVGQPVRFTSDDPAAHNVRSSDTSGPNAFSLNTAAGSPPPPPHRFAATPSDRPVALSCDIHPWMIAWVYAFDSQSFTVTDARGRFRLDKIPTGTHRVGIRQPAGRLSRDVMVEVSAGGAAQIEVRFTPADLVASVR
jgi:plastocyanin